MPCSFLTNDLFCFYGPFTTRMVLDHYTTLSCTNPNGSFYSFLTTAHNSSAFDIKKTDVQLSASNRTEQDPCIHYKDDCAISPTGLSDRIKSSDHRRRSI